MDVLEEEDQGRHYRLDIGQMLSIPFILVGVFLVCWALAHPRVKFSFPNKFPEDPADKKKPKH